MENGFLILVDENDQAWGKLEKQLVHEKGLLHRAFSVFIFNSKGEMLLQQRAENKYHSGGLWTNACCSHPQFGEETTDAVARRLKEEIGLKCKTKFAFSFKYKATFENGLIENEFDHVYVGLSNEPPIAQESEVKGWKYESIEVIKQNVETNPEQFTVWFKLCFEQAIKYYSENKSHLHATI